MTRHARITYPTTWYKVECREVDGQPPTYVAISRLLGVDARKADGTPAAFSDVEAAYEWCRANSPKSGWRK